MIEQNTSPYINDFFKRTYIVTAVKPSRRNIINFNEIQNQIMISRNLENSLLNEVDIFVNNNAENFANLISLLKTCPSTPQLTEDLCQKGLYTKLYNMLMESSHIDNALLLLYHAVKFESSIYINYLPLNVVKPLLNLARNDEYSLIALQSLRILSECQIQEDINSPIAHPYTLEIIKSNGFEVFSSIASSNGKAASHATYDLNILLKYNFLNQEQLEITYNLIKSLLSSCNENNFFELNSLMGTFMKIVHDMTFLDDEVAKKICAFLVSPNVFFRRWPLLSVISLCKYSAVEADKLYEAGLLDALLQSFSGARDIDDLIIIAIMEFILSTSNALNKFIGHSLYKFIESMAENGSYLDLSRASIIYSALLARCETNGDIENLLQYNSLIIETILNIIECSERRNIKFILQNLNIALNKSLQIEDSTLREYLLNSNFIDIINDLLDNPHEDISETANSILMIIDE